MSEVKQMIADDLEKRGFKHVCHICSNDKDEMFVISYDTNGLVRFIYGPITTDIQINEGMGGRAFRSIVGYSMVDDEEPK